MFKFNNDFGQSIMFNGTRIELVLLADAIMETKFAPGAWGKLGLGKFNIYVEDRLDSFFLEVI
jgi:hypothetical protein